MKNTSSSQNILRLVELSILIALTVVLQLFGGSLPLGLIPLTFSLIPIAVGAIALGPKSGTILGFSFGVVTLAMTSMNPILVYLFQANPVCYILVAIGKATFAGLASGLVYKFMDKVLNGKHKYLSTLLASVTVPIVNTGLFVIGMFSFFFNSTAMLTESFPQFFGGLNGSFQVIVLGLVGFNFIGEVIVNVVLSPAIARMVAIIGQKFAK